jgi:hypothetical protein
MSSASVRDRSVSPIAPDPADVALASEIAQKIAAASSHEVRRVVMFGSRALGCARSDSDLDLVVLIEPPAGGPPWRSAGYAAARKQIQGKLRPTAVPTDLWVRTTDRFEEARRVVGGVEWLAEHEGVNVYSSPLRRPPEVRLSPGQIRRQNVSAWIEHALLALDAAAGRSRCQNPASASGRGAEVIVERAVNAALVARQVYAANRDGLPAMLDRLETIDRSLADRIRGLLGPGSLSTASARGVVADVVRWLCRDREMARYLERPRERLAKPMILLDP